MLRLSTRRPRASAARTLLLLVTSFAIAAATAPMAAEQPAEGAAATAATAGGPLPTAADGYFHETRSVVPGVWVLHQPAFHVQPIGNVTVIEQSAGLVLVDTGGSPGAGRRVVERVRSLSDKPVTAVIVTHWHGDHPLGLGEVLRAWPQARTIATRATQEHLRTPRTMNTPATPDAARNQELLARFCGFGDFCARMSGEAASEAERRGWERSVRLFAQYTRDMDGALTLTTAESFDQRLLLADPRAPVEALFLGRANTDGDAVVWLPTQRVLISGDVVVAPIPFGYGSYPGEWIAVLERLRGFDFAHLVPGHGEPQTDRVYLDALIALLREVRAQVAPLAAKGLALAEVRQQVDLASHRRRFAGDDPWLGRWFAAYFVEPIVTSAYREARGEPIEQSLG